MLNGKTQGCIHDTRRCVHEEDETNSAINRNDIFIHISGFNSQSNLSLETSIGEIAIFVLSHRNLEAISCQTKIHGE
jgi:hypothetical protein